VWVCADVDDGSGDDESDDMNDGSGEGGRSEGGAAEVEVWVDIWGFGDNTGSVSVRTIEAPVCEGGLFKHRFPVTTQLARVVLGAVALFGFDDGFGQWKRYR